MPTSIANLQGKVDSQNALVVSGTAAGMSGLQAQSFGSSPTAVASGSQVAQTATRDGVAFVLGGHPNVLSYVFNGTTARSDYNIFITVPAAQRLIITSLTIVQGGATDGYVSVGFGAATLPALAADGAAAG